MNPLRKRICKHLEAMLSDIHKMSKDEVFGLLEQYKKFDQTNCAWYEYRAKSLVIEVAKDHLNDLTQKGVSFQHRVEPNADHAPKTGTTRRPSTRKAGAYRKTRVGSR